MHFLLDICFDSGLTEDNKRFENMEKNGMPLPNAKDIPMLCVRKNRTVDNKSSVFS